ncbi:MAG TPA: FecR domain-containing protein [Pyrinomonadaceae bacterium]
MKSGLRAILKVAGLLLCFALAVTMSVEAQNREKYVISAKAGGINQVTGDVTLRREGAKSEQRVTSSDDLESGDVVSTGVDGRIEVLLNPGSYLRVGANAEFELTDASLDSLEVNLHQGNAIIEVASADGIQVAINIVTPQSNVLITKGGIYRFNVLPGETTEIFVRKGRLLLGKGDENRVKGGQKIVMRQGRSEVAKFDKKEQDTLDEWSKERAKTLARANAQLQARSLSAAFRSLNTWDIYSAAYSGAWVFNPSFNSYCFFPISGRGWSSPYGYGYTNTGGWTGGANPYNPPTGNNGGGSTGSGNGNGGGSNNPTPPPTYTTPTPSLPPPVVSQPPSPPPREMPSEPAPHREYTREP